MITSVQKWINADQRKNYPDGAIPIGAGIVLIFKP